MIGDAKIPSLSLLYWRHTVHVGCCFGNWQSIGVGIGVGIGRRFIAFIECVHVQRIIRPVNVCNNMSRNLILYTTSTNATQRASSQS